jgi:hypothetical protein
MTVRHAQPVPHAEKVQQQRQLVDRHTTAHKALRPLVSHALVVPLEAGRQERPTQVSVLFVPLATTAPREPLNQYNLQ